MLLKDKVAVITGAASGIGKEIAIRFAQEGAKIVIADLDQNAAKATAAELDPAGRRALGIAMDVANEDQVMAGSTKRLPRSARSMFSSAMPVFRSSSRLSILNSTSGRSCSRFISTAPF